MGSGRGKSRRVSALYPSEPLASQSPKPARGFDADKWADFLYSSGVEDTGVFSYYLGHKVAQEHVTATSISVADFVADLGKLASNLFADAVAVGALELPRGYNVNSFKFNACTDANKRWARNSVDVRLRDYPHVANGDPNTNCSFPVDPFTSMQAAKVADLLERIDGTLRVLERAVRAKNSSL